ncbi:LytR/AlgR family response regulator transcription factor [Sphingobacterium siyangense]|jgi:DNA-binding LytR/AlgR family response regulator|uniref:LytR/AlgR family response regulator transcription factor n=1 Tax=Sphingobacterium siyangense TaxID=459529 RepID=UPI00196419B4|nr:LytTR family DNA-binding domain-containing protein [Sphingobacterium siyangense]QRY56296.1 response regulator transcription factor [Sphingobacterium siyangense]
MKCIIVEDEPIARRGITKMAATISQLELLDGFNNAESAAVYLQNTEVDLIFLDINMPGINGIEFARTIPKTTLIIFTTAYSQYAVDSYELDAVDYLVKPIDSARFRKAVDKAIAYHALLLDEENKSVDKVADDYIFVKSDRRFYKVNLADIFFIEGLKDYIIIQMENDRIITRMTIKNIYEWLPKEVFIRVNRSFIVNKDKIDSFDNNDIYIQKYEVAIGNVYRNEFLKAVMGGDTYKTSP